MPTKGIIYGEIKNYQKGESQNCNQEIKTKIDDVGVKSETRSWLPSL